VAVASAEPHANLHLDPHTKPHQHLTTQLFIGRMPFLPPNQQHQSTEGTAPKHCIYLYILYTHGYVHVCCN